MSRSSPELSIAICTRNRAVLLKRTLTALLAQAQPSARLEVLVVDNDSHDQTADVVRAFADVRYVREPQLGIANARNRALLMPSYYESFGLVALEAMAHGLPIVGYANSALPEVVERAGALVPSGDTEALAQALVRTLTDDQVWLHLSAHATQRAAHYTVARQVEQSLAIYRSISAKNASVLHDH
jgi:glycosyltransferase involved in cell wall biosynthesis